MRKSSAKSDDIKKLSYFPSKIIPHIGSTVNPLIKPAHFRGRNLWNHPSPCTQKDTLYMELSPHLYFVISRFTNNFPWHLNLVIVWKFCILSQLISHFWVRRSLLLAMLCKKSFNYERILKIHTFPTAQLHEIGFKNYLCTCVA